MTRFSWFKIRAPGARWRNKWQLDASLLQFQAELLFWDKKHNRCGFHKMVRRCQMCPQDLAWRLSRLPRLEVMRPLTMTLMKTICYFGLPDHNKFCTYLSESFTFIIFWIMWKWPFEYLENSIMPQALRWDTSFIYHILFYFTNVCTNQSW